MHVSLSSILVPVGYNYVGQPSKPIDSEKARVCSGQSDTLYLRFGFKCSLEAVPQPSRVSGGGLRGVRQPWAQVVVSGVIYSDGMNGKPAFVPSSN